MKFFRYLVGVLGIIPSLGIAQISLEVNAWTNLELSAGQETSHYYYNQIHADYKDWRVGVNELTAVGKVSITPDLSINARGQLIREKGGKLSSFRLPLGNLAYSPSTQNWSLTVGRFLTPFGNFAARQHPKDREFINFPLSHSYYTNVSPKVGFAQEMGESRFMLDGQVEWGSPLLYYGGYSNGLRFDWDLEPDKLDWSVALTNGSPNMLHDPFSFDHMAVISKLRFRPAYFWEQQLSISYGSFGESTATLGLDDQTRRQFMVGTDIEIGYKYWEFRGEVIYARYNVPEFVPGVGHLGRSPLNFSAAFWSVGAKYEFPFISGMYATAGIEQLVFGKLMNNPVFENARWDNDVFRVNAGLGYKINSFLLFRMNLLHQTVKNHPAWAQDTFRSTLTIFY